MAYPGEKNALEILNGPYSASLKAKAALKLREIDRIDADNRAAEGRYRARQAAKSGECPTCGK